MRVLLQGHHTAGGLWDSKFAPSVWFHCLAEPSLIISTSADLTLPSACRNEDFTAHTPKSMGARSPSPPIGLALAERVAKMGPPSHSVMQAVMAFRSLCPMKDSLSRCGWPPYIINSSAEAFMCTIRTGRDSILITVGHMPFSTS